MTASAKGLVAVRVSATSGQADFVSIHGMRVNSVTFTNRSVDVTDGEGQGWRKLLTAAGTRTVRVQAAGVFLESAGELVLRDLALSGATASFELELDSMRKMAAEFVVAELRYVQNSHEEVTYSVELESASSVHIS